MLSLTTKKYEVEEKIQLTDEDKKVLYEFTMQITPKEMIRIRKMLLDETYKLSKIENEDEVVKKSLKMQEEFEDICFKENKEEFKKINEYKYLEMVDLIYDFFMNMFIEKRAKQVNTMNTRLNKIGNN